MENCEARARTRCVPTRALMSSAAWAYEPLAATAYAHGKSTCARDENDVIEKLALPTLAAVATARQYLLSELPQPITFPSHLSGQYGCATWHRRVSLHNWAPHNSLWAPGAHRLTPTPAPKIQEDFTTLSVLSHPHNAAHAAGRIEALDTARAVDA
eukprot:1757059-Amphidinium_carterae.1